MSCQQAIFFSKFQNTAFLLVVIKIWIYFGYADISKKDTSKQETSLIDRLSSIPQRLGFRYHINMKKSGVEISDRQKKRNSTKSIKTKGPF